ncbi:MGA protein, partial [Locustella ochotensis]|nr:MGA protein [Locustella ochotensis]
DVQYTDIDYMERNLDFTLSSNFSGLPALVNKIKAEGMRFIIILDPAISGNETNYTAFDRGVAKNVFLQRPDTKEILYSKVWSFLPGVQINESLPHEEIVAKYGAYAAFPDFFRNSTVEWWKREIMEVYNNPDPSKSLKFDGLWIDMNEPAAFINGAMGGCRNDLLNNPPYMPNLGYRSAGLIYKSPCMESQHYLADGTPVRHYDVHNLYGWSQTKSSLEALQAATKERGVLITRSTYPSSGRWAGHWLGDNSAIWEHMHRSIIGTCSKRGWAFLASPDRGMVWVGRDLKAQPVSPLPWQGNLLQTRQELISVASSMMPSMRCVPAGCSWVHFTHTPGITTGKEHGFVQDRNTWDIDEQFLWGPALLISPVLKNKERSVIAYFPDARWYDYHTDTETGLRGQYRNLSAPLEHINLHIRGGYILPWQTPANTTAYSRKNPMGLTVALDDDLFAEGHLYWDDGVRIGT